MIDPRKKAIVLTFDRLPLRFLGCYGNPWIETPNFDRLAARSVVFDQHFAENVDPTAASHAWFNGCYQFPRSRQRQQKQPSIAEMLRDTGITTRLVSEQTHGQAASMRPRFNQITEVIGRDGLEIDHADTPFGKLMDQAVGCLKALSCDDRTPWLLWLQSRGVPVPWIAPEAFATLYFDELAGRKLGTTGPDFEIADLSHTDTAQFDASDEFILSGGRIGLGPDRAENSVLDKCNLSDAEWRVSRAVYAGYVTLLDFWLGRLLDEIEQTIQNEELLFIVTADRGESLGERDTSTIVNETQNLPGLLGDEIVHSPLIVSFSRSDGLGSRQQELVQAVDLVPTLFEWFQIDGTGFPNEGRSFLTHIHGKQMSDRRYLCLGHGRRHQAIRTSDFYLVQCLTSEHDDIETDANPVALYLKPEDIWDVNDVAAQSRGEVESLSQTLEQFVSNARQSQPLEIPCMQHTTEMAIPKNVTTPS